EQLRGSLHSLRPLPNGISGASVLTAPSTGSSSSAQAYSWGQALRLPVGLSIRLGNMLVRFSDEQSSNQLRELAVTPVISQDALNSWVGGLLLVGLTELAFGHNSKAWQVQSARAGDSKL
ncbi:unnamed protein product, partial [Protopolystoma xenopodis]